MKRSALIVVGLIAISVFLLSAGTIITQPQSKFPEKEIAIALRNVGHRLLLHAGDSTSRVLPVKQLTEGTYRLEFKSAFAFVPDSLVSIVQQSLEATPVPLNYTVNVLECNTEVIVYGFQIGNDEQTTLVPCLGREQPEGCYVVVLSFLQPAPEKKTYLFALALVSLVVTGFVGWAYSKNKNILTQAPTFIIGKYEFYVDQRKLTFEKTTVELSDKETQLLQLFAQHINQPVAREVLMKEVWHDNGVLISRSLDVFVSRLRKKLKDDSAIQILNVHGMGYKLIINS
ncbi:MAG: winged helix-turn-helix transcriptional regulator [Cyclobacteriaceae bacterium]|nr:winged helix-turn-helix transcriptional regulator [Cyclobacteriaceae bacterium]